MIKTFLTKLVTVKAATVLAVGAARTPPVPAPIPAPRVRVRRSPRWPARPAAPTRSTGSARRYWHHRRAVRPGPTRAHTPPPHPRTRLTATRPGCRAATPATCPPSPATDHQPLVRVGAAGLHPDLWAVAATVRSAVVPEHGSTIRRPGSPKRGTQRPSQRVMPRANRTVRGLLTSRTTGWRARRRRLRSPVRVGVRCMRNASRAAIPSLVNPYAPQINAPYPGEPTTKHPTGTR